MEPSEKKKYIADKLLEAGTSGKKLHVISRRGQWVIINEASKKAVGIYKLKQQATKKANALLDSGLTNVVIFHNKDGSVAHMKHAENSEIQYTAAS
jgi:hypothetical protein